MTSLESISREAAKVLPEFDYANGFVMGAPSCLGKVDEYVKGIRWLHESTEACTEIMVRVLWQEEIDVLGGETFAGKWSAWTERHADEWTPEETFDDPMLAFRVAVLRAVVALKGQK